MNITTAKKTLSNAKAAVKKAAATGAASDATTAAILGLAAAKQAKKCKAAVRYEIYRQGLDIATFWAAEALNTKGNPPCKATAGNVRKEAIALPFSLD